MDNELFEKAPIPEAYFSLAMPVVLSMLVTLVYNMVDTYFIAHTGNTDMVAGVSLTAPVFTVMIALGDIFGLGGSSVISRLFGQHRFADGKRLSAFCFYAAHRHRPADSGAGPGVPRPDGSRCSAPLTTLGSMPPTSTR